jgi:hypothetical protein
MVNISKESTGKSTLGVDFSHDIATAGDSAVAAGILPGAGSFQEQRVAAIDGRSLRKGK